MSTSPHRADKAKTGGETTTTTTTSTSEMATAGSSLPSAEQDTSLRQVSDGHLRVVPSKRKSGKLPSSSTSPPRNAPVSPTSPERESKAATGPTVVSVSQSVTRGDHDYHPGTRSSSRHSKRGPDSLLNDYSPNAYLDPIRDAANYAELLQSMRIEALRRVVQTWIREAHAFKHRFNVFAALLVASGVFLGGIVWNGLTNLFPQMNQNNLNPDNLYINNDISSYMTVAIWLFFLSAVFAILAQFLATSPPLEDWHNYRQQFLSQHDSVSCRNIFAVTLLNLVFSMQIAAVTMLLWNVSCSLPQLNSENWCGDLSIIPIVVVAGLMVFFGELYVVGVVVPRVEDGFIRSWHPLPQQTGWRSMTCCFNWHWYRRMSTAWRECCSYPRYVPPLRIKTNVHPYDLILSVAYDPQGTGLFLCKRKDCLRFGCNNELVWKSSDPDSDFELHPSCLPLDYRPVVLPEEQPGGIDAEVMSPGFHRSEMMSWEYAMRGKNFNYATPVAHRGNKAPQTAINAATQNV